MPAGLGLGRAASLPRLEVHCRESRRFVANNNVICGKAEDAVRGAFFFVVAVNIERTEETIVSMMYLVDRGKVFCSFYIVQIQSCNGRDYNE